MDPVEKLALSSRETIFESDGAPPEENIKSTHGGLRPAAIRRRFGDPDKVHRVRSDGHDFYIHLAASGSGRQLPLLKSMLTSACERNCNYCPFRAGRDFHRVTFQPEELAQTFIAAHRSGLAEGLFLSTGIFAGGANTQNKLLDTAEILRKKLGFPGYLHPIATQHKPNLGNTTKDLTYQQTNPTPISIHIKKNKQGCEKNF